jgi:hypothetical protein
VLVAFPSSPLHRRELRIFPRSLVAQNKNAESISDIPPDAAIPAIRAGV